MNITLDQARVFESVARLGTLQMAAKELNKAHSAIVYAIKNLEHQLDITLFNRQGYRNTLSAEGVVILKYCCQLLLAQQELVQVCARIKNGWEPSLKFIYDGIVDFQFIGDALLELTRLKSPTELKVLSAHLNEVETLFKQEHADMMVTILPLQSLNIPSVALSPINLLLVAEATHALHQVKTKKKLTYKNLNQNTFIAIKSSPGQVGLGTEQMAFDSYLFVNDFHTKKAAILKKLGFGWLPDYLIQHELKNGQLKLLNTTIDNLHTVHPRLYYRHSYSLGRASKTLLRYIKLHS